MKNAVNTQTCNDSTKEMVGTSNVTFADEINVYIVDVSETNPEMQHVGMVMCEQK